MATIYPTCGHALNEARIRGRVYDTCTGQIMERHATLAAIAAGEITPRKSVNRSFTHPSYHTREAVGGGLYIDHGGHVVDMTLAEVEALFDKADAVLTSADA